MLGVAGKPIIRTSVVQDLNELEEMVALYHQFEAIATSQEHRLKALQPVLDGTPLAQAFMIDCDEKAVGYMIVTFTWSIEFGGPDAMLDELFIREGCRGRGLAQLAIKQLLEHLRHKGVLGLSLEVARTNERAIMFYEKLGFDLRAKYSLMTFLL